MAKHLFTPNADPTAEQTKNPFDHSETQVSVPSALGTPPPPSGCSDSGNGNGSHCEGQDRIFRFSSAGRASRSGSKSARKKAVGARKAVQTEVPRKSARKFSVCLKRRKTSKNGSAKSGSSSSQENSSFGWGLGVAMMYMMSAGKFEISKLNVAVDETAKVVQELKTELYKRKSSQHLRSFGSSSEVDAKSNKNSSRQTQATEVGARSTGPVDNKISSLSVTDDGECTSSVLTEEPEPLLLEIDQLEAELESELQKLPWSMTETSQQQEIRTNLGETYTPTKGFHEAEGQSSDSQQFHGVVPAELDQKLSRLLIEQQEHQIVELESELHSAQSKLNSKEAELQALKECVRRLTNFSLSTVSDDEAEAQEELVQTDEWDFKKEDSESNTVLVGMKRPMDSESRGHYVR